MALRDWIKVEHNAWDKTEVRMMGAILDMEPEAILGYLVKFWCLVDANCVTNVPFLVGQKSRLDRDIGVTGFVDALVKVGWADFDDSDGVPKLTPMNYEMHLSQSAKKRASDAKRKAMSRTKSGQMSQQTCDKSHTKSVTPSSSSSYVLNSRNNGADEFSDSFDAKSAANRKLFIEAYPKTATDAQVRSAWAQAASRTGGDFELLVSRAQRFADLATKPKKFLPSPQRWLDEEIYLLPDDAIIETYGGDEPTQRSDF